jgi:ABC-2 type transport system ATP-binding protein
LIDDGCNVLYGNLTEIREHFSGHAVLVQTGQEIPSISGIEQVYAHNGSVKLVLDQSTTPQAILSTLVAQNVILEKFEIAVPSLDEIFIRVVAEGREGR